MYDWGGGGGRRREERREEKREEKGGGGEGKRERREEGERGECELIMNIIFPLLAHDLTCSHRHGNQDGTYSIHPHMYHGLNTCLQ